MSTLQEIEVAVRQLGLDELAAFRRWFAQFDAEAWDRQFEQDVAACRLDELGKEALAELREGRTPGYSADVRLSLVVGNEVFEVGQVGPDDFILRQAVELPPCDAELVIAIDDSERRHSIRLNDGIQAKSLIVKYTDLN